MRDGQSIKGSKAEVSNLSQVAGQKQTLQGTISFLLLFMMLIKL